MSILDTIDNAIADWDLSADAMRWTPEPTATPGHAASGSDIVRFAESCGLALDAWQRAVVDRQLTIHINAFHRAVGEAMQAMGRTLGPLFDELHGGQPRRSERVTRMRRAYPKRWRRR